MLKNKIVLITGASSGIGMSCARDFAKAQAKLLLCARRLEKLNELARELQNQYGIDVHAFKLDVSDLNQVQKALHSLPEAWKAIDILVNNAGLAAGFNTVQEANIKDWELMIDTNVKGLLYVTREVLPQMVAKDAGHIINIGSIAGHEVYPKGAIYCATKHAVKALTEGLRFDLLGTKIRVSSVDPGAVETNFSLVRFKGDAARAASIYQGMEPLRPEDISDIVLYCASRPLHVNIREVIVLPTDQVSVTHISRKQD